MKTSATKFKAKLGQYMRAVRQGKEVIVTDRDEPVARLVPFLEQQRDVELEIQPHDPTAPALGAVGVRGVRYDGPRTTEILRADRDRR